MKHPHNYIVLATIVLPLVIAAGCRPSGSQRYPVAGTVTLDGQLLPKGEIIFFPTTAGMQPDAAPINEGKFSFQSLPGKKRVEIRASRPSKTKKIPGMDAGKKITWVATVENYIPARYNTKSELFVEVCANGSQQYDFQLGSKDGQPTDGGKL